MNTKPRKIFRSEVGLPRPEKYIEVSHSGESIGAPLYKLSPEKPKGKVALVGGLHGWETSSVVTCLWIVKSLAFYQKRGDLEVEVRVLPLSNLKATKKMQREVPVENSDLNRCFPIGEKSFEQKGKGKQLAYRWADKLMNSILSPDLDFLVDVHSAGKATYWPHAIVTREDRLETARDFGLNFAIVRNQGGDSSFTSLVEAIEARGIPGISLEVGGGYLLQPELIESCVVGTLRFLKSQGWLQASVELNRTAQSMVFKTDRRELISSEEEGLAFSGKPVGVRLEKGERMLNFFRFGSWREEEIVSPEEGYLIYRRDFPYVREGETLAMILPVSK